MDSLWESLSVAVSDTPSTFSASLHLGVGTPLAADAAKGAPTPTNKVLLPQTLLVDLAAKPEAFGWEAYSQELSGPQGAILPIGFPAKDRTMAAIAKG
ncbi:MAG: hypothetical protein E2O50_07425 [Gammaproteobacteria bacterium]|nr:MAG: hypothetical protein E2O50_07425 [Gammaproteobacteria bacterium]